MTPTRARRNSDIRGPVLITGGAGFIGSNLADRLCGDGYDVIVLDALTRAGVQQNIARLMVSHPRRLTFVRGDVRDSELVRALVTRCGSVAHLAAQVAVTTSIAEPLSDHDVNVRGTLNVLEAVRSRTPTVPLVFASTNKVYGTLDDVALAQTSVAYQPVEAGLAAHGISESRPVSFRTPYGCSKGAADQYVLDYAQTYGLPAVAFRMSCVYGPGQCGNEDQGWVAHFLRRALARQPITIFGDGAQVRDILYVSDAVEAYVQALACAGDFAGTAWNLGGGASNAVSVLEVIGAIEELVGARLAVRHEDWRRGDQRYYVSDLRKVTADLGLREPLDWHSGLERLAEWFDATDDAAERSDLAGISP